MIFTTSRRCTLAGLAIVMAVPKRAAAALDSRLYRLKGPGERQIAIYEWHPKGRRRGVILFSHGALSAPWKYDKLIQPWAEAGYHICAPLHVDSTDHPLTAQFTGLASWRARIEDMRVLARHVGASRYVAAGHSYGGLVALTLGGAAAHLPEGWQGPLRDPNAVAVVAFSPPGPAAGLITADGYARLAVPALIQTGTRDVPPASIGDGQAWRSHLTAYDAAAAGGDRFALVLEGVDHYFGGAICRPELPGPPLLSQLGVAGTVSRLFMDAYACRNRAALSALRARLDDTGPVILTAK